MVKNQFANAGNTGDLDSIFGSKDPLEEESLYSSILAWKNSMDRGVWQAAVHGVAESGHD